MTATLPNPNPFDLSDLDEYRGLENNRDQRWQSHLRWMFDNQPDLSRQLHQSRKLGLWVDRKYQEALNLEAKLLAEGASPESAREISNALLANPDGPMTQDNPPPPLSQSERNQIERSL